MTKQSMPAVTLLDSKTLDDFKTADKVVVVGYFAADDKTSNKTFDAVAEAMREDFVFGATSDPALAKAEGIKVPGVVLYKSFDEGKNIFDGTFSDEAITKFAKVNSVPLVGEVGPETYSTYMAVRPFRSMNCFAQTTHLTDLLRRPEFPSLTSSPNRPRSANHTLPSSQTWPQSTRASSTLPPLMPPRSASTPET